MYLTGLGKLSVQKPGIKKLADCKKEGCIPIPIIDTRASEINRNNTNHNYLLNCLLSIPSTKTFIYTKLTQWPTPDSTYRQYFFALRRLKDLPHLTIGKNVAVTPIDIIAMAMKVFCSPDAVIHGVIP